MYTNITISTDLNEDYKCKCGDTDATLVIDIAIRHKELTIDSSSIHCSECGRDYELDGYEQDLIKSLVFAVHHAINTGIQSVARDGGEDDDEEHGEEEEEETDLAHEILKVISNSGSGDPFTG